MTVFKVNYHDGSATNSRNSIAGFNDVGGPLTTGVRVADLLDTAGVATGFTLTHPTAFTGESAGSTATTSPDPDFPVAFFDSQFYVNVGASPEISNLPPGATYTIKAAGGTGGTRDTQYNATNSNGPVTYITNGEVDPVPQPVSLTGTVPASGIVILDVTEVDSFAYISGFSMEVVSSTPTTRKSSTFDIETTLGTITTATLNGVNVFDHVTGQTGTTVSFAGAATDEITTSGEYTLTLGDGTGTEDITVQVNVYGVAPSNNPVQKDGAALASLTGVQLRVTNGANINGTELFYSGTATTDASGNLSNIDLSSTAAADADPVLLHMRTAAGDSIIASETVGLL